LLSPISPHNPKTCHLGEASNSVIFCRAVEGETPHFAFAVVFVVHLHLLFSCHPSPQAEDLLLAFALVVASRISF